MKKLIGILMIMSVFIVLFVVVAIKLGFLGSLAIFAASFIIATFLWVGAKLVFSN